MTGSSARKPSARPSNIALKCYSDSACVMFWHGRNYACGKFFPQTGLFAKSNPFVFSCPRLALKLQYLRADEVAQSGCASGISARVLDSVAPFFCAISRSLNRGFAGSVSNYPCCGGSIQRNAFLPAPAIFILTFACSVGQRTRRMLCTRPTATRSHASLAFSSRPFPTHPALAAVSTEWTRQATDTATIVRKELPHGGAQRPATRL
jgi:hypothetical protein